MSANVAPTSRDDQPTTLYRLYDAEGRLLYVGIARRWTSRMGQHASDKPWFSEVASVKLESHECRHRALTAERRAIEDEKPAYNVTHNMDPDGTFAKLPAAERVVEWASAITAIWRRRVGSTSRTIDVQLIEVRCAPDQAAGKSLADGTLSALKHVGGVPFVVSTSAPREGAAWELVHWLSDGQTIVGARVSVGVERYS